MMTMGMWNDENGEKCLTKNTLMLVCARLRHVAGSTWGEKRYMNMDHLLEIDAQSHTLAG